MPSDPSRRARPAPARLPDLDDAAIRALAERANRWVVDYLVHPATGAVLAERGYEETEAPIRETLPVLGQPLERLFADLDRGLRPGLRQDVHPAFFGYIHAPGTPLGAYADLIASAVNQNLTSWRSAPAAVAIERQVIAWIREMVGFGDEGEGLLTSGGSMATLTAMAAARAARLPDSGTRGLASLEGGAPTVYMSEEGHLSIIKAADLLGIGRENVRRIPTGPDFRIDMERLAQVVQADRQAGRRPFLVAANAGSVSNGAIDPLEELADFCWEQEMWLHVDAAYGGFAALVPGLRNSLQGLSSADSVTLDPHKWLYANLDVGCVLIRDAAAARKAFAIDADYARADPGAGPEAFTFFDHGPELSRRFRALKLWMMIKHYGVQRLAACIAEDLMLARYLYARVEEHPELEALCPVGLSIVCFRYRPPRGGDPDALNAEVLRRIQHGSGCYLSHTRIRGRFALRACVLNPRTEAGDIDRTVEEVARIGQEVAT